MKKKELLEKAKKELLRIKEHATLEERTNLLLGALDGDITGWNSHRCVYGKMTGDCENLRSRALMQLCAGTHGTDQLLQTYRIKVLQFNPNRPRIGWTFLERCLSDYWHETIDLIIETQLN